MKRILIILFTVSCSLFTNNCSAQQPASAKATAGRHGQALIDSLLQELPKQKDDTNKVNLFHGLSFNYNDINPDEGIKYGQQDSALAAKLHWKKGIAEADKSLGKNYHSKANYPTALAHYETALKMDEALNDKKDIAALTRNIGIVYYSESDYPKALGYYFKALKMDEEIGDKNEVALATSAIGIVYYNENDYPKALEYYFKALKMDEEMGDKYSTAKVTSYIGVVYAHEGDYPKALEYDFKALKMNEEIGNKHLMAAVTQYIGCVYGDQHNYTQAAAWDFKALQMAETVGDKASESGDLHTIGVNYMGMVTNPAGTAKITDISELPAAPYLPDSLIPRGRKALLHKAVEYLNKAITMNKEVGDLNLLQDSYLSLSTADSLLGDYKGALDAYMQHAKYHDSVFSQENAKKIVQQQMKYDFGRREDSIKADNDKKQALTTAEITRQRTVRNGAIGGSLLLLIAGASSFSFYKRKRDADQAKKDAELKAQVTDTELKALRAQMNPHFIFNSLNSVSDYIARNEVQAAGNYLTKFARLMRTILENSEEKEVPLTEDLEALEWYMQLETLRMNHKFTYKINVSADIDLQATMIPPMILQPFVENSIWHGLSRKTDGSGRINIQVRKDGQMLCCIVEDNGVGRSGAAISAAMPGKTSLGMKITQSRIDVINQQKGTSASIELTDLPQGMKAEIKLPLLLKF